MDKLSPRQQRFVDEYLVDLNGQQAAIRAGYAPRSAVVTASRLLTRAKVREAIELGRRKLQERTEITAEWVIREIAANHQRALDLERPDISASNKALDMLGRVVGVFEKDNQQRNPVSESREAVLARLQAMGVVDADTRH